jgi:hypothetical protein
VAFKITTTGTLNPVIISDLGFIIFHPTVDDDFALRVNNDITKLYYSKDLRQAQIDGHITIQDENNYPIDLTTDGLQELSEKDQPGGYLGVGNVPATSVSFTPDGDISSTNVQDAIVEVRDDTDTKLSLKIDNSEKGAVNGVATLDGGGKIPFTQLPNKMMEFEGNWDASTNTPTLANTDIDKQGTVYRVSVAGTVDFGAGNISFTVGDWVYNTGTEWQKGDQVSNSDEITHTPSVPSDWDNVNPNFPANEALDELAKRIRMRDYGYAEDLTESSTTSQVYQLKLQVDFINAPAGTFYIHWTLQEASTATNKSVDVRIQTIEDPLGVPVVITQYEDSHTPNQTFPEFFLETSFFRYVNPVLEDVRITVEWRCGNPTMTAYIRNVRIKAEFKV